MKVIVIGGTGTIGGAVVDELRRSHDVITASRTGDLRVDLADTATVPGMFDDAGAVDAVVCCAASAPLGPLTELSDDAFLQTIAPKLLGQVSLARHSATRLNDGGSITLTSGTIPEGLAGSAGGALVNAGIDAFVRAAAVDLDRGLRLNAVSPGWVAETLTSLGMDAANGTPARDVARAYVKAVEGSLQGQIL